METCRSSIGLALREKPAVGHQVVSGSGDPTLRAKARGGVGGGVWETQDFPTQPRQNSYPTASSEC